MSAETAEWPVKEFRALLDRVLSKTGLTQGALAALVPMDQSQLSRWKSGDSRPKYENLSAFADAIEREHPDTGISKREILTSGGYGATLRVSDSAPVDDGYSAHVNYVRRTVAAFNLSLITARRALEQTSRELDDLARVDCGTDCCIGIADLNDAGYEQQNALRAVRHMERVAEVLNARLAAIEARSEPGGDR